LRIQGGVESTSATLRAALDGRDLHKWVDDKNVNSTDTTVLTDATLYYNLVEGEQVVITGVAWGIITASDDGHFTIGSTTAVAGGGDYTALCHHMEATTGTAKSTRSIYEEYFDVPIIVKYSSGARSITMRAHVNDTDCNVTVGWHGFRMHDPS